MTVSITILVVKQKRRSLPQLLFSTMMQRATLQRSAPPEFVSQQTPLPGCLLLPDHRDWRSILCDSSLLRRQVPAPHFRRQHGPHGRGETFDQRQRIHRAQ